MRLPGFGDLPPGFDPAAGRDPPGLNGGTDCLEIGRLHEVMIEARRARSVDVLGLPVSRQRQQQRLRPRTVGANPLGKLVAVRARQADVDDGNLGRECLDRFPDLDPAKLQDPADVARTVRFALSQPRASAIAELTVVPLTETSWP